MKGRKPRTTEQKAYIATRKELNKMAEKLNDLQAEYGYLLDEFAAIEATLSEEHLAAVEKIFVVKEARVTMEEAPVITPELVETNA